MAYNLNEARKARDGNKKCTRIKEPTVLHIGDNVLVRDHTSKAFQPKYKDFCIVGLLGKKTGRNQRQSRPHNQGTPQRHEKDTHGRESVSTLRRRTARKNQRRQKSSSSQQNARIRMGCS